ncbi:hypothetical protein UPYG_G00000540 [Umbra pygmaea]|uniref:Ig-like domain-containing protein n=1 Tax=Umbra pygmaea TaxID=75934 RepID=A0ABD0XJ21_UMBPY
MCLQAVQLIFLVLTDFSSLLCSAQDVEKVTPKVSLQGLAGQWYSGESITFLCSAQGTNSSRWHYVWFKDSQRTQQSDLYSYTLNSAGLKDSGKYSCRAKEAERLSVISNSISITIIEPPVPNLSVQSGWYDVFPSETVELNCGLQDASTAWVYKWSRDDQDLSEKGATLSISSATQTHSGTYQCSTSLPERPATTKHSYKLSVSIYPNQPVAVLFQDGGLRVMYVGEKVSLSCWVTQSSGWQYVWYKDSQRTQLPNPASSQTTYTISSAGLKDSGTYWCRATRGKTPFYSEYSHTVLLKVEEPPVPNLSVQSGWLDVFPSETVELNCGLQDASTAWVYKWSRDDQDLSEKGATLSISSVTQTHSGTYQCSTSLPDRPATTKLSNKLSLSMYPKQPVALLLQDGGFRVMYVGEKVSFSCGVNEFSGWQYVWYKDSQETQVPNPASSQTTYTIRSAGLKDSGTYWCRSTRGKTPFYSEYSKAVMLEVKEPPVPILSVQSGWLDVFPSETVELNCGLQDASKAWVFKWSRDDLDLSDEGATLSISSATQTHSGIYQCSTSLPKRPATTKRSNKLPVSMYPKQPVAFLLQDGGLRVMYVGEKVSFSCGVNESSGWQYVWYKDSQRTQLPNPASSQTTYTISSAGLKDSGTYWCRATRGKTPFYSEYSKAVLLEVKVRPWAVVTLETGWEEVWSTNSLVLKCDVRGSPDNETWNYIWYQDDKPVTPSGGEQSYTVTSANDPNQSLYTCKGNRTERPTYTTHSEPFKTKNLVLKRKVLLSISGCLFFGIIAVFIGCILIRFIRKPVEQSKITQPDLFMSKGQLKSYMPSPLAEYVTEQDLQIKDTDDDEAASGRVICSETTPLPISDIEDPVMSSGPPEEEMQSGGMLSFTSP